MGHVVRWTDAYVGAEFAQHAQDWDASANIGVALDVWYLTEGAQAFADGIVDEVISRNPVWLPRPEAPQQWTAWDQGGTNDKRLQLSLTLVRSKYRQKMATAVRSAIRDGSMSPALDALNALQAVPWTINKRVLGVIRECTDVGLEIPGLPEDKLAVLDQQSWNDLSRDQRALRKLAHQALGARVLFREDIRTAERLAEYQRFYTAMNLEWRGRVYCVPSFNFQREDRVRALFLFADGAPIGDEGMYWLKVHVANCGDFERISKRSFRERVKWVDDNLELIRNVAETPVSIFKQWIEQTARHPEHKWQGPDKPFLFLAACMELVSARRVGPSYVSQLPVSFDGSCSGLQHLCAMTRAPEGSLVNLTPQEVPADIYQTVADKVEQRIKGDLKNKDKRSRELAQMCLGYGITRKIVKRNVMTYSYGSKVYGMTEQLREDLMQPLSKEVQLGKLEEHPFADGGYWTSKYLARNIYDAIEEVVYGPAQAMAFLQKLARAMSCEGKPLQWKTPVGLPWINRYQKVDTKQVKLWLHDRGVRVPYKIKLAIGDQAEIDKNGAANGVAPNFVHALDAAHLLRTVNAAVKEGITSLATVRDSFGCLPSRAARFRRLIREEFVRMYKEHDVLAEVYEHARADPSAPGTKRMPSGPPQKGSLEIEQLLGAEFAFA